MRASGALERLEKKGYGHIVRDPTIRGARGMANTWKIETESHRHVHNNGGANARYDLAWLEELESARRANNSLLDVETVEEIREVPSNNYILKIRRWP